MDVNSTTPMRNEQGNIVLKKSGLDDDQLLSFIWPDFVTRHRAAHIMSPIHNMIQVRATDSVRSTLWTLIKHKVQCVPVFNEATKKYIGLVDILDLVEYISTVAGPAMLKSDFFQVFKSHPCGDTQIQQLVGASNSGQWFTALESSPIDSLLDITASGNFHKVPVIGSRMKLSGLVTQLGIVQFLADNVEHFSGLASSKMSDLAFDSTEEVCTIHQSTPTVAAFSSMSEKNVKAIAIVDDQGRFVDFITSCDAKGLILGDLFSDLRQPVLQFLSKSRILSGGNIDPIFAEPTETVGDVLTKIAQEKTTSIFVLNAERAPSRVVNLRDILRAIVAMPAGGGSR